MEFQWEKLFSGGNSEMSGQHGDLEKKKSEFRCSSANY